MEFPVQFVGPLAAIDESKLSRIAAQWASTEELRLRGGDDVLQMLVDVRRLAVQSRSSSEPMFLRG